MKEQVLGVCIERLSKEPCIIRNKDEVEQMISHGGLVGRLFFARDERVIPGWKGPKTKGMLFVAMNTIPANGIVSAHWHDMEELWYFTSGEGILIDSAGERKVRTGDGLYVTPNGMHEVIAGKDPVDFLVLAAELPGVPYEHGYFEPIDKVTLEA